MSENSFTEEIELSLVDFSKQQAAARWAIDCMEAVTAL